MPKRLFLLDNDAGIFLVKNIQGIARTELNIQGKTSQGIREYIRTGERGALKFFFCSVETMQELLQK
jgi:hypothetical protein